MYLYSTNSPDRKVDFKEAVLKGFPADKGLYMPVNIPKLPSGFFKDIGELGFVDLAFQVSSALLGDYIPKNDLRQLMDSAFDFDAPLVQMNERFGILELFHGPSLAFKDFGARFMAQVMSYLIKDDSRKLTILVATSGDTGGAVAAGFYGTPGIEVIILYPSGKVSPLQEKQLTTLGDNITALEIRGNFDDCQALVKEAFLDEDLNSKYWLTSANSINIARLIPQSFYYFRAFQQLPYPDQASAFIVPSGNFGNLTAGLIAQKMGLPVEHFVAATNANKVVPAYLDSGEYHPGPSIPTISNAMDVGNPSNFARMKDLFGNDWQKMKNAITGYSFEDEETREAMKEVHQKYNYVIDPHGAVGYLAWKAFSRKKPDHYGVILETAHPSKFLEVVEPVLGEKVPIPQQLGELKDKLKKSVLLNSEFRGFKDFLMGRQV